MTRQLDVKPRHQEQIERLLRGHLPGVEVWAYGSRVNGRSHEGSDLDLVLRSPGLVKIDPSQLAEFNEAVQESTIPFLIEARDWARLPDSFQREIEREYVVLVAAGSETFDGRKLGTAGEWHQTTLGTVIDFLSGGTPSKSRTEYWSGTIPWVSAKDMKRFRLQDTKDHLTPDGAANGTKLVPAGTVLLLTRGMTLLNDLPVCVVERAMTFNQDVKALRPRNEVSTDFLPYIILGNRSRLLSLVDLAGHGTGRLNSEELKALDIQLPPLPEQHTIAHILGTLDDKIELNRRMNETLEEMARALFKSWFIDFDPVHAKAALRNHPPNHSSLEGESAQAQATAPVRSGITPPLRGSRQAKGDSPQASRWGDHAAPHPPRRWAEIKRQYSPQTLQRAQALRQNQTNAEGLLWHYLSRKQLAGYRFRRQQPIGPYIADFACLSEKLLIELDGGQHAERTASDNRRDRFLQEKGYRVLRFWNHEVFENCFGVLESIYAALPHHPPLEGGSKDGSLSGRGSPPPPQPAPNGLASATPPPGGSDWSVERARAYLDGMDPGIAALFPDRFVDSELGEVPAGWETSTIGKEVGVVGGSTPSTKEPEFWNGDVCWATPKDLSTLSSPVLLKTNRTITEAGLAKISSGLLPAGTVLLSSRAPIGYLAISETPISINQGFIAMKCMRRISSIHAWLWSKNNMDAILQNANGSTFQEISKRNFRPLPMIVASNRILATFNEAAKPLYERIAKNERESYALTALRDTLLPKLISGELRVEDS